MKKITTFFAALALIGVMLPSVAGAYSYSITSAVNLTPAKTSLGDINGDGIEDFVLDPGYGPGQTGTAQNTFLANIANAGLAAITDDFEHPSAAEPNGQSILSGGATITSTPGAARFTIAQSQGRAPTSKYVFLDASSTEFTIDFTDPVVAFGFYGIDIGDWAGELWVDLVLTDGTVINDVVIPQGGEYDNGNLLFWGIQFDEGSLDSVTFHGSQAGIDWYGFDDMIIANAIPTPEPSAFILLGIGLAGLGVVRRFRK